MSCFFTRLRAFVLAPLLLVSTAVVAEAATRPPNAVGSYVEAVLRLHPELKVADAQVAAAEAKAVALGAAIYNPELAVDGQRGQSDTYSLGLNQTFDISGKRSARRLSGQKLLQQAVAEREATRQRVVSGVLVALTDYQSKQVQLALVRERLEVLRRFASVADLQYRAGDTGILDRNLGSLALAEGIAIAGRAELDALQARRALDTATGNTPQEPPSLPPTLPAPTRLTADFDALTQALASVQAARAKQDAALAEVEIARSNRKADPTIGLRGGRETSDTEPGKTLVGLQLSIPLFVRNGFGNEQAAASAEVDAAGIETAALMRQSSARMKAAAGQFRASYEAWQRWSETAGSTLDNGIELLERVWKVRELGTSEYLAQLKQLLDGRAAGEQLRYQTWAAWFEWLEASGQWREALTTLDNDAATTPLASPLSGNAP